MPRKRIDIKLTADEQHLLDMYVSQGHKHKPRQHIVYSSGE
jgi:hypothetical protein